MSDTNTNAEKIEDLPVWAQNKISELRNEAAKYRTERNAAQTSLQTAQDEVSAQTEAVKTAKNEAADAVTKLSKLHVAIAEEIPVGTLINFAGLLQGSTEDELKTHAQTVKGMLNVGSTPPRATDRSQGRGNNNDGPLTAAQEFASALRGQFGSND